MTAKQQYRSEIGILSDILRAISDSGKGGITISTIARAANIAHSSANEKCQKLVEASIVRSVKDGRGCTFFITENGAAFFEQLRKFTDMMRSANIRY